MVVRRKASPTIPPAIPKAKSFQSHLSPYDLSLYSVAKFAPIANPIPVKYEPSIDTKKMFVSITI